MFFLCIATRSRIHFSTMINQMAMPEENAVVQQAAQPDIPGIVKLAPVLALPLAIPLALPLALHAIHGIGVGGLGLLVTSLAMSPQSKEFIKSSGDMLSKILPVNEMGDRGKEATEEMDPPVWP
jgi:hypothetical protein